MKVGVVGKGGSGKTTLSWLLSLAAHARGQEVYALDADFNQHLSAQFGVDRADVKPLAAGKDDLVRHVMGTRSDVTVAEFKKTTQPCAESRLVKLSLDDDFLRTYLTPSPQGIRLLRVGEFGPEDKGWHCYHGLTAVADILLNHLEPLEEEQVLLVDFTAGVDPFASPITESFDAFVLSVEPTLKGVEVARQWRRLIGSPRIPLQVVVNKVQSDDEVEWVRAQLPGEKIVTHLYFEPALRRLERGEGVELCTLRPGNAKALETIWSILGPSGRGESPAEASAA